MCMRLRKGSKSDIQRTSPEGMFRFISSDGNGPPSGTARRAGIFISGVPVRFAFLVSVLLFTTSANAATMEQVAVAASQVEAGYASALLIALSRPCRRCTLRRWQRADIKITGAPGRSTATRQRHRN